MQVKSIADCLACIKLPFAFKNFILSIFEWLLFNKTDLTVNVILVFIVASCVTCKNGSSALMPGVSCARMVALPCCPVCHVQEW